MSAFGAFGGIPAELMNTVNAYAPSPAVNRDTADTCAPRGSEYRTRRDFNASCPAEAGFQEPNSMCCTSGGPEESRRSSHEYLRLVHAVSSLSNRGDWETLPFNFRRILDWITLPSNNVHFIATGPRLRLDDKSPFVKDVVKLAILLKSTAVIELFEKPDKSPYPIPDLDKPGEVNYLPDPEEITYATTAPRISDRDDGLVYGTDVAVYPQCPIFNDMVDAVKESRSYFGHNVLSVTVDLGSNFVPDIAPLPSLPYMICHFAGSTKKKKPLDLQDVVDYGHGQIIADERCIVTKSPSTVVDAFVFLLKERAGGFKLVFKNTIPSKEEIPEGYSSVVIDKAFVESLHKTSGSSLPLDKKTKTFTEFKYGMRNKCEVRLENKVATLTLKPDYS